MKRSCAEARREEAALLTRSNDRLIIKVRELEKALAISDETNQKLYEQYCGACSERDASARTIVALSDEVRERTKERDTVTSMREALQADMNISQAAVTSLRSENGTLRALADEMRTARDEAVNDAAEWEAKADAWMSAHNDALRRIGQWRGAASIIATLAQKGDLAGVKAVVGVVFPEPETE